MKLFNKKWKWAVAVILLLGASLFLYFLYTYFFYTCCALSPESVPDALNGDSVLDDSYSVFDDPDLLYAKRAFIGLCRTKSGYGGSCHYNTYLYFSGKLIEESGEVAMAPGGEKETTYPTIQKELDKNSMDRIIKQIRDSEIMNKSCAEEMITDYFVDYFINLDGIKKKVQFPGCESEFKEIDKLIDVAVDK